MRIFGSLPQAGQKSLGSKSFLIYVIICIFLQSFLWSLYCAGTVDLRAQLIVYPLKILHLNWLIILNILENLLMPFQLKESNVQFIDL